MPLKVLNVICTSCKKMQPTVEHKGEAFIVMHAKNPKRPNLGHCEGSGRKVRSKKK
jgi:hypothetical protein